MWKSDVRWRTGQLSERLLTASPADAEAHFRRLLARADLIGQPCAARLVSPITRNAIYFSHFDRDIGDGRIHANAPLDTMRTTDGTREATKWIPISEHKMPNTGDFGADLRAWLSARNLSPPAGAQLLGIPESTFTGYCDGDPCPMPDTIRKLTALI